MKPVKPLPSPTPPRKPKGKSDIAAGLRKLVDWRLPLLRRASRSRDLLPRLFREGGHRALRVIAGQPALWLVSAWTWEGISGMRRWRVALAGVPQARFAGSH